MKHRHWIRTALTALLLLALSAPSLQAQYLPASWHGVRHCMLMYPAPNRDSEAMKPYAAKMVDGQPEAYLFDSYVFLKIIAASGQQTDSGQTTKADWLDMLDRFYHPTQDIAALDKAIDELSVVLGEPPARRKVFIGIPWPNPAVRDFGDVDGDGIGEDLAQEGERRKVLNWYIDEALARWELGGYQHVDFAGFYWIREENNLCVDSTRAATEKVHAEGKKFLWIPYYRAPGYQNAYDYFDIVVMQPNYAFHTWMDGGTDRPVHLVQAAKECADRTFGFEIENRSCPPNACDGAVFRRYLAYGAAAREGYQAYTNAYFLDALFVESTYGTEYASYYYDLCDYVLGNPIPDPDLRLENLCFQGNSIIGQTNTGETPLSYVDVVIEPARNAGWRGILTAEMRTGAGEYTPVGWRIVNEDSAEETDCYTIPVEGTGDTLRITFTDWVGHFNTQAVQYVLLDGYGPRRQENHCLDKPYTLTPDDAVRPYPDNARCDKLTDAVVDHAGFPYADSIGWLGPVRLQIDLGGVKAVNGLEVYGISDGARGVQAPLKSRASFSSDTRLGSVDSGAGGFPMDFATVPGARPVIVSSRSEGDRTEKIQFSIDYTVNSRYITLELTPAAYAWTMLSEIRVTHNGETVPIQSYTPATLPTPSAGVSYANDGHMLTDGVIAQTYSQAVTGWASWLHDRSTLTVDMTAQTTISKVSLHALGGGEGGIFAPDAVAFYASSDGGAWSPLGTVQKPAVLETGGGVFPVEYALSLPSPVSVRYLRAVIQASAGWCMLSEVTAG